jgi:hypothetical protein
MESKWKRPPRGGPVSRRSGLECGFDLKTPRLEERFRNVLGVFISARPLTQTRRSQILIRLQFELANHLFELSDRRSHRPNGLGFAPVGITTSPCHCYSSTSFEVFYFLFTASWVAFNLIRPEGNRIQGYTFQTRSRVWLYWNGISDLGTDILNHFFCQHNKQTGNFR